MKHVLKIVVISLASIMLMAARPLDCDKIYKGLYIWEKGVGVFKPCGSENGYRVSTRPAVRNKLTDFYKRYAITSHDPIYIEFRGHLLDENPGDFTVDNDGLIRISELRTQSVKVPNTCTSRIHPYQCRSGYFPSMQQQATWGVITGKKGWRSHFYDDGKGCPYQASCKQKPYLIPGDKLMIGKTEDGWACVWYPGKRGGLVGWMNMKHISLQSPTIPKPDDWLGTWVSGNGNAEITIRHDRDALIHVDGTAIWDGGNGVVHDGSLSTSGRIRGDRLILDQGVDAEDCKVQMRLLNGYLMVADNRRCGGMNVSFSDIYQKEESR